MLRKVTMYEAEHETGKTCIRILRPDDIEQAYMLETEGIPCVRFVFRL